jgi:hypothetical protein
MTAQASITRGRARKVRSRAVEDVASMPIESTMNVVAKNVNAVPSMNTSPWAKLMSSRIP